MIKNYYSIIIILLLSNCNHHIDEFNFLKSHLIGERYYIGTDCYQEWILKSDTIFGYDFVYSGREKIKSSTLKIYKENDKTIFTIDNNTLKRFKKYYVDNCNDTSVLFKNFNPEGEPLFIKEVFVDHPYSLAWGNFYSKKLYRYDFAITKKGG